MVKTSLALSALLVTMACGSASSPTSPTPTTSATITSIGLTIGASSGAGFQITARAAMSDGTSTDVTTAAAWESLNPALATISAGGFVTVIAAGELDFRATYQAFEGRVHAAVQQTRYTISGRISPVYPNRVLMSGVTVQILSGPNAGMFVKTDSTGGYLLTGLTPGFLDIKATVDGFSAWSLSRLQLSTNTRVDPVMFPTPPVNELGLRATGQCNDISWTYSNDPSRACNTRQGIAWGVCPGPLCESLGNIR